MRRCTNTLSGHRRTALCLVLLAALVVPAPAPAAAVAGEPAGTTTRPEKTDRGGSDPETTEAETSESEATPSADPLRAGIVVTARRARQPAFETDRAVERVSSDELHALQPRSLPEALQETTGVFVQQTNRGAGSPFLRGLVGPQNLILVDGVRFNNSTFRTGPNQYLNLIDASAIDAVEVMLGPGSVLYGSDAMGGVVQVLPVGWGPAQGFGGRAGAGFLSADLATSLWGDVTWQGESIHVLAGGAYRDFGQLRAGGGDAQPLSDYRHGAWRGRALWEPRVDVAVSLNYFGTRLRDAGRTDRLYEGRFRFYDNDDDLLYLDVAWTPGGVLKELRGVASFHRTWEQADLFRCDLWADPDAGDMGPCMGLGRAVRDTGRDTFTPIAPMTREQLLTDQVFTPGGLVHADLSFWEDRIRATVGADAYWDYVQSRGETRRGDRTPAWEWADDPRGNFSDGSTYLTAGAFALVEGDLLPTSEHRLIASIGGRVAHFRASAPDVPGIGDLDYDHTGFAGTASLRYLFDRSFMTYATWAQGFRAPNLQETTVLGDTGSKFEVPNGDLGPERNDTFELGARLDLRAIQLRVSGYYTLLSDVIDERSVAEEEWALLGISPTAVGDKPVVQRVNGTSGWYTGVEARLSAGPFHGLVPWARVTWSHGEVDREGGAVPARRIPPLNGGVGLRYEGPDGRFYVELYSLWAARQDRLHPSDESDLRMCEDPARLGDTFGDSGLPCNGTPGWITLNVRGGFRVDDVLRIDIAATNLADANYRYHASGFDAPGAGVSVSVEGQF